ncbi:MAG: hypothetical protein K0S74_1378 [Chlamydiales bacterium]|jgi:hypothetical protein|nr:hypothetical protein [Chlamydiales bacterium]
MKAILFLLILGLVLSCSLTNRVYKAKTAVQESYDKFRNTKKIYSMDNYAQTCNLGRLDIQLVAESNKSTDDIYYRLICSLLNHSSNKFFPKDTTLLIYLGEEKLELRARDSYYNSLTYNIDTPGIYIEGVYTKGYTYHYTDYYDSCSFELDLSLLKKIADATYPIKILLETSTQNLEATLGMHNRLAIRNFLDKAYQLQE